MRRDAVIAVVAILLLGCGGPANAHQSAQGWSYPLECCAGQDCKEVPAEDVQSVAGGFRYRPTGEHVPQAKARTSGGGHWHICRQTPETPIRCLFYPPPGW